ncbi:hypothetical protein AB0O34_24945 [Sphaerisporangium sp. NPDC088356]|uniref:hypothetical protein n=1 Tax=Sphaerisporangium sp. NPDC088356 TaxID=3154871 RepID=UPI003438E4B4
MYVSRQSRRFVVPAASRSGTGSPEGCRNGTLTAGRFILEAKRPFVIDLRRPLPAATGRYAHVILRRLRAHLDGLVNADELDALDILPGDGNDGLLRRDDLTVRTTRTVWVARRP